MKQRLDFVVILYIALLIISITCYSSVIYAQPQTELSEHLLSELDKRVEKVEILALQNYTKLTTLQGIGIGISFVIVFLQLVQLAGVSLRKR